MLLHGPMLLIAPVVLACAAWRIVRAELPARDALVWLVLVAYAIFAANLLFFPLLLEPAVRANAARVDAWPWRWINLVPLFTISAQVRDLGGSSVRQLLGNVGLLLPLGLLGPVVMQRLRSVVALGYAALVTSVGIELLQFAGTATHFLRRSVDVDDVILNVLGALLGWGLWWLAARPWLRATRRDDRRLAARLDVASSLPSPRPRDAEEDVG